MSDRLKKSLLIAVALLPLLIGSAFGMSQKTKNILNHVGQVSAAPAICPDAEVDDTKLAMLLVMSGIDLARAEYREIVSAKMRETIHATKGESEDRRCAAVFFLYGPNGQNVPGLVRRK